MKYLETYASFLEKRLDVRRPIRVVFDCSNGTVGPILKALPLKKAGITASFLNARVDGTFPAHGPDPSRPGAQRQLRQYVRHARADLGVAFDADGDRALFIDNAGRRIDPDVVAYLLSARGTGAFLIDVRTGWLVRRHISNQRWRVVPVGHAGIKREMRRRRIRFAAERSGHYYFNPEPQLYMDSGILAALAVLSLVSRIHPPRGLAAEINELPRYFRSRERSVRAKEPARILDAVEQAYRLRGCTITHVDGITAECETFWLNLRESGTENVLRLNAEAVSSSILDMETRRLRRMLAY